MIFKIVSLLLFLNTNALVFADVGKAYCENNARKKEFVCLSFKEMQKVFSPDLFSLSMESTRQWLSDPLQPVYEKGLSFFKNHDPFAVDLSFSRIILSDRLDRKRFFLGDKKQKLKYLVDYLELIEKAMYVIRQHECKKHISGLGGSAEFSILMEVSKKASAKNILDYYSQKTVFYEHSLFTYILELMDSHPPEKKLKFVSNMNDSFHRIFALQKSSSQVLVNMLRQLGKRETHPLSEPEIDLLNNFLSKHISMLDYKFKTYQQTKNVILVENFRSAAEVFSAAEYVFEKYSKPNLQQFYDAVGGIISSIPKQKKQTEFNKNDNDWFLKRVQFERSLTM